MAYLDPAPPRLAGPLSQSSGSWVTFSRRSITMPCMWNRYEPVGTRDLPFWRLKSLTRTGSPWTRIWCTLRSRPTIVRQILWQVAWEPRAGSATRLRSKPMAATSCAVAEDITHTSTHVCGSATASFFGVATSSATPAVNGQKCTRASEIFIAGVLIHACDLCGRGCASVATGWSLLWIPGIERKEPFALENMGLVESRRSNWMQCLQLCSTSLLKASVLVPVDTFLLQYWATERSSRQRLDLWTMRKMLGCDWGRSAP